MLLLLQFQTAHYTKETIHINTKNKKKTFQTLLSITALLLLLTTVTPTPFIDENSDTLPSFSTFANDDDYKKRR